MSDKITEIQNKWDEGCETGVMDAGDLFGSLLDVAYELEHELIKVKALATSEVKKDMSKDKPSKDQVILFMARNYKYPEIGVFKTYENDCSEIYIPSNDDAEKIENVEWWMEVPE